MSSESLALPPKLAHEDDLRRLLAIALAEGAQAFFIINEPDHIFVPSRSERNAGYVVDTPKPGCATCPCKAFEWRGYCSHVALAFWLRHELEPAPLAEVTPLRVLRSRKAARHA
jgi:hypothetical protein